MVWYSFAAVHIMHRHDSADGKTAWSWEAPAAMISR
jgi:hypothetical protein